MDTWLYWLALILVAAIAFAQSRWEVSALVLLLMIGAYMLGLYESDSIDDELGG